MYKPSNMNKFKLGWWGVYVHTKHTGPDFQTKYIRNLSNFCQISFKFAQNLRENYSISTVMSLIWESKIF